ncbi:CidA/LrgA family protein [Planktotalea sp.]|uniref:CidA/LrgA family protein n=1 Tax=Planktotalea sp. TaxID=2029877 RepID=UPI0025EEEAB8|nr:CidA/LrgA family protein [Planktotalea sp.]
MIAHIAILLSAQLIGEVTVRSLGLPIPGPVLGMGLLLILLIARPKIATDMAPTTSGLLSHLSLLFVPAGVGIITHLDRIATSGFGLTAALIFSTWAALIVGAWTFIGLARLTGSRP